LAKTRPVILNATERRLSKAFTIADLREIAKRRTPRAVFDYTDGAAEEEISLGRARRTFRDLEFAPSVLRDVSAVDLTTNVLGRPAAVPFSFAPTGFTRLMQHEGESAVARVAARRSIPYALSTMGTTSIEGVREAVSGLSGPCGDPRLWFQLYVWRDRGAATDLIARAASAGYEALILTVDVPVSGARLRDARNGFSIPAALSLRTLGDMALHPAWWANLLSTEPLAFASMSEWRGTVAEMLDALFDPTMTVDDLEWLRGQWPGPLVVKGIQSVDDARRVVAAGADAVILSNHGGRQLDRAPVPLRLVPDVRDAVGESAEVWVDTGIMSGADVLAAVALGATTALVGRAYLYGLMAGGERGVDRAAQILTQQAERTMKLLGVRSLSGLGPQHVRLP
jgi:L-lactate dehydrogenase (cytochrome)